MANTYSQINIQAIFAVQGKENLLDKEIREELIEHISDIIVALGSFPLVVNGTEDHFHLFFDMSPEIAVTRAIRQIKTSSAMWVNEHRPAEEKFQWQKGYAAFTYSRSQKDSVIHFIRNQENFHKKSSFRDEYLKLLENYGVEFNKNFLFEFYA